MKKTKVQKPKSRILVWDSNALKNIAALTTAKKIQLLEAVSINNIYWISASPCWPVCTAGAVVICKSSKRAIALTMDLYKPEKSKLIGHSNLKEQVVVTNNGEY